MAALWMLLSGVLFATSGVFARLAGEHHSVAELTFWRGVFVAAGIAAFVGARGGRLATPHWRGHLARSAAGVISLLAFYYCLVHSSLATAVTLNYTSPLFLALIGWLSGTERVRGSLLALVLLGFAGVVLLLYPFAGGGPGLPGLIGLGAGAFAALAYRSIRQLTLLGEPEWRTVYWFGIACVVTGGAWMLAFGATPLTPVNAGLMLGLGVFSLGAQWTLTIAYGRGRSLLAGTLSYSGVLFSALADIVLFALLPSVRGLAGMALIVGACVLSVTLALRHRPS